eukprot:268471_1
MAQADSPQKEEKKQEINKNIQISQDANGSRRIGRWFIAETLGKGGYSWVKKGIDRKNGRIVALKFMERRLNSLGEWKRSQQQNIKNEIETLKRLRHDNIVRLLAYNLNAKYPDRSGKARDVILLVLEYAAGGELFDILYYTEKLEAILARTYFHQLVAGIECMHRAGIIHRDIKPQNLLLDNKYNLKITDFGLSKIDPSGNCAIRMSEWHVGTRGYQAPEILLRQAAYDLKVDVFAMGVVLFILLGGYPPFEHAKESDKWYRFIVSKKYKNFWKSHRNCGLRQAETDLITRMLCFDPDKRISIERIKRHSWYKQTDQMLSNADLIKVLRHRHQRMEEQRNVDPAKQGILATSARRPLEDPILRAIALAGKTENDLPPLLPANEMINGCDIYTSTLLSAYEVLQALQNVIIGRDLKGVTLAPSYNQVDHTISNATDNVDTSYTCIDVVNYSLLFSVAIDIFDGQPDLVYVHIAIYHDPLVECNLVKFTRLSGDRKAFKKIIDSLSVKAGECLTGLDPKAMKKLQKTNQADQDDFQQLYKKCFPK